MFQTSTSPKAAGHESDVRPGPPAGTVAVRAHACSIGMVSKMDELVTPRPNVADYYARLQQRPSFRAVFGPQQSPLRGGAFIISALAKAAFCRVFNW